MKEMLIVFGNRTHTLTYQKMLKNMGVKCEVVPTPRELGVSCGLSVKTDLLQYDKALYVLKRGNYSSFQNFYEIHYGKTKKYSVYPSPKPFWR